MGGVHAAGMSVAGQGQWPRDEVFPGQGRGHTVFHARCPDSITDDHIHRHYRALGEVCGGNPWFLWGKKYLSEVRGYPRNPLFKFFWGGGEVDALPTFVCVNPCSTLTAHQALLPLVKGGGVGEGHLLEGLTNKGHHGRAISEFPSTRDEFLPIWCSERRAFVHS